VTGRPYNITSLISPDDSANLLRWAGQKVLTDAIYVGTGGDVVTVAQDDATTTWKNVPSGTFLLIAVKRVNATNTTALNLVACYWE